MILITGCAGFIGFHLCKRLLIEGKEVIGIDNLNNYYDIGLKKDRLAILNNYPLFNFEKIDISNSNRVFKLFKENSFDIVINLAAQAGVRYSLINPRAYINSNVIGFFNIIEACKNYNIKHLIYASSSSVYGSNEEIPFNTSQKVEKPLNLYAATKKADELMAHTYSHLYQLPTTGLRFFTVYGPWGRPDMALFIFTDAIFNNKPIKVFNYGNMRRDFTYIDDIIESIIRLLDKPLEGTKIYKVYNIGNGNPVKLEDFIDIIEKEIGISAKRAYMPMQKGDIPLTYADCSELVSTIDFHPNTGIETGVKEFIDWYKIYYKKL